MPTATARHVILRCVAVGEVAEAIPRGPDLDRHVEAVAKYVSAGYMHVALGHVGDERQSAFLDWAQRELPPALRELGGQTHGRLVV